MNSVIDELERAKNAPTLNSKTEFWHQIALHFAKQDELRSRSAREVARYVILVRRAAEIRDTIYRQKIERLLVQIESMKRDE